MTRSLRWLIILGCCLTQTALAIPQFGASFTYPLIAKDPAKMTGYRGSLWYQPPSLVWQQGNIYFEGSFAHWYITNHTLPHRIINIVAIAPVFQIYIIRNQLFSPFIAASIGLSYMDQTHFDDRNLGMHFAFQDIVTIGATMGKEQRLSLSLSAMHYSNGSLGRYNAGITIPLVANISYGFS